MDYESLIRQRYSCRKFTSQPVDKESIKKIIEAAIYAPTAVNLQPFHIFTAETEKAKNAVRSCTSCHFGAETFLIMGSDPKQGWVRQFDSKPFADMDAAIAATHMLLKIHELGLASTWVGSFDPQALQKACPALKGWNLIGIFPIGYPAEGPGPRHAQRKSSEELVTSF